MQRFGGRRLGCALIVVTALVGTRASAQANLETDIEVNSLGDSQADLVYTPVTPCRIIDTRLAGGALSAGLPRSFKVTGDTTFQGGANCGIPFGPATSAMINFVAVNPAGPGNMRLTPFGQPMPKAAIINYSNTMGTALANGLAVALCNPSEATCTNDVTIRADVSAVDLVADVEGYFQRVSTGGVGTSLLADAAVTTVKMADGSVTAPKIGSGVVVRNLNGLTDAVTLAAGSNVSITPSASTLTISATGGSGGGDITSVNTPAGGGLQGGVTSGDANLALLTCGAGLVLKSNGAAWACATDADTGSTATPANTPNAIVRRDASGSFVAGTIALAGNLALPNTTASAGMITLGGSPFLHNFGSGNTFVGTNAGNLSMTGSNNTGVGLNTLQANTTANNNSAFGNRALQANTTGLANSAFGQGSLGANTTGSYNSAFGPGTLSANTTGNYNSAFGLQALFYNTTGASNSAVGYRALLANTEGSDNSAFGNQALLSSTAASYNSAFGSQALDNNTTGETNSAFGYQALYANTAGGSNSAVGVGALAYNTTGSRNTAIGYAAGQNLASGNDNIYIGNPGANNESNTLRIGSGFTISDTYVAGIYAASAASGAAVYVSPDGKLGVTTSSHRYKEGIADMAAESDVLMKLRPVSFYYKPELDGTHTRQYGLVAEEVAEIAPELVLNDENGAPQTVRYHFVNAMLLNEVQKQRRQLEAQDAEIRELRAQQAQLQELKERLARLEARLAQ